MKCKHPKEYRNTTDFINDILQSLNNSLNNKKFLSGKIEIKQAFYMGGKEMLVNANIKFNYEKLELVKSGE